ncbi:MAG: isopentenyl-diphosphate Delta-isomerase [Flavobacteriales bacterium AspAUS03]
MKAKGEQVILVGTQDEVLGLMDKQKAHIEGLLHRAISIFVFNNRHELMLQQRAAHKYHSPLLWANTCCSHPRQGETTIEAAHRCLVEEMGFDCPLEEQFYFTYKAEMDNILIENELDHVLLGRYEGIPKVNPKEVTTWRWIALSELIKEIRIHPEYYAIWLRIIIERYAEKLKS